MAPYWSFSADFPSFGYACQFMPMNWSSPIAVASELKICKSASKNYHKNFRQRKRRQEKKLTPGRNRSGGRGRRGGGSGEGVVVKELPAFAEATLVVFVAVLEAALTAGTALRRQHRLAFADSASMQVKKERKNALSGNFE